MVYVIDFIKIFKEIDLHKNDLDIDNFMTTIINPSNGMQPNKSWDLFKELDYTTEVKSLTAHIIDTLEKEASPFIEQGTFSPKILRSIEDLADETELDNYAEYPLFLAYALKLAQASINHYKTTYPERKIGYSIGYGSGDFITGGWI